MSRNHQLPSDRDIVPMPQQDLAEGKELTPAQQLAEDTHGIATLPNAITAVGLVGTAVGCQEIKRGHNLRGLGTIAVGAVCDFVDGYTARHTRVANYRVGRWADIAADGIKAALVSEAACTRGLVKRSELALIYGPKVANWAINGLSQFILHNETKTTNEGKVAEASRWLAMATLAGWRMLEQGGYRPAGRTVKRVGYIATAASFLLGAKSTISYLKELAHNSKLNKLDQKK